MSRSGAWFDVCASADLLDGGDGVRFECAGADGLPRSAFVVRQDGRVRAFVNRCPHRAAELDWLPGRFFDDAGLYLVCSMHGALFEADTGDCVAGPCLGDRLEPIACEEREGRVRVRCAPVSLPNRFPGSAP